MRFTKMHALGNDYVFLDAVSDPSILTRPDLGGLTAAVSDRHTGIGSDGVIVVWRPEGAAADEVAMRIINADGSDGGMCGNGARCVCKLAVERGHVKPGADGAVRLRVGARGDGRVLGARVVFDAARPWVVDSVTIDMGTPRLDLSEIPVDASRLGARTNPLHPHQHYIDGHAAAFVNVGNPHLVIFTSHDPDAMADRVGPSLETHPAFPERINVQIARVVSAERIVLRTWERGAGRTQACGTGACAAVVAGVLTDRTARVVEVSMAGGDLRVEWEASGRVLMTGGASHVFDGEWPESLEVLCAASARHVVPVIETARLRLRPVTPGDAGELERMNSTFEVAKQTTSIPHPYPPGEGEAVVRRWVTMHLAGEAVGWIITRREDGRVMGAIGLRREKKVNNAEIGYTIDPGCWGQGYATEAARAVTDHAFAGLGVVKVFAGWYADNPASGRVLEKAGFVREGYRVAHGERFGLVRDLVEVGMTRAAWEAGRSRAS